MTLAEKQSALIEALKYQAAAKKLTRRAYLDESGAGDLAEAAARLESCVYLLRSVSMAIRREDAERRGWRPFQAA